VAKKAADFDYLRDDIHQLLGESEEGTDRVRQIVQDLRDFSRATRPRTGRPPTCTMGSTAPSTSPATRSSTGPTWSASTALPLVECLPSQLNQVFMNLFVNAAQAMPDGRRGTHRHGPGWGDGLDRSGRRRPGHPPRCSRPVFDPFFTTKPIGKGTGLGLSLSYGIVKKHHGNISGSTPGRDHLPHHPARSSGGICRSPRMSTSTEASFTLLCVDDEANILSALRRLFRPHGYKVLVAGGGAEGLEMPRNMWT
jgi:signal transduction histidine kinase